ncbi:MAG: VWA domain-containing protein, partial [Actinomycetota bacterium]
GLYHSSNGGRTLAQNPRVPATTNIGVVDIFHWNSTYPAWIRAFSATYAGGYRSNDGGANFTRFTTPGIVQSASNAINRPETVIATNRGVYVVFEALPPPNNMWNISPPRGQVFDVQAAVPLQLSTTETYYTVYARTDSSIERFTQKLVLPGDPDELLTLGGLVTEPIDIPPPHLNPPHKRIVLERGEFDTIDYDLVIPNSPDPLDVYFLVDISGSMQDAINGIRAALQDIYDQLNDSKINVYFGVGEYRSYTDDPAYHRILPVSQPGPDVAQALNSLDAEGGGEETQTEALYQAATGEGRDFFEAVPVGLPVKRIEAGQEAGFRPDALKVILMVTDEEFSQGGDHRPYDETIAALSSRDIFQLGLAIQEGPRGAEGTPRFGLNKVAAGTDARAPAGGVDCDGNGSVDIAADDPLVCVIDPERAEEASLMAPAIVNLLLAVDDPATVEIEPVSLRSNDAEEVVKSISPPIPGVNFKKPNRLDFDVTYRCPRLGKDKTFEVKLQAVHDGLAFETESGDPLTTTTRVVCRAPIPEPEPKDPVAEPPLAIVLPPIAPPPPRPPDIVTNPNPQPQGQAQANAALAAEKEQQPQLALAHQGKADEVAAAAKAEEKYAMSSYRDRSKDRGVPPEAVLMIGAASMCMMFGCATLAQQRARTQQVRR